MKERMTRVRTNGKATCSFFSKSVGSSSWQRSLSSTKSSPGVKVSNRSRIFRRRFLNGLQSRLFEFETKVVEGRRRISPEELWKVRGLSFHVEGTRGEDHQAAHNRQSWDGEHQAAESVFKSLAVAFFALTLGRRSQPCPV